MTDPETTTTDSPAQGYVVAIGASAGGLSALTDLVAELPEGLAAPIVIGVHSDPSSVLAKILAKKSRVAVKEIEDGETLVPNCIYVIPGAKHAFFQGGGLRLSEVVEESGFRPSIDALFMTLAAEYGRRGIGVVLSGTQQDGMRGAQVLHDMGGQTIVQDPRDAEHATMPRSVIQRDHPEAVETATGLGRWLRDLIGTV